MADDSSVDLEKNGLYTGGDVMKMLLTDPLRLWRISRGLAVQAAAFVLVMTAAFTYLGFQFLGIFNVYPRVAAFSSLSRWELYRAAIIEREPEPVILLDCQDNPGGWGAYDRLLCVRLRDGRVLGEHISSRSQDFIGATRDIAWLKKDYASKRVIGYSIPKLRKRFDALALSDNHPELTGLVKQFSPDSQYLRVYALDGYQYRLDPVADTITRLPLDPPAPRSAIAWSRCDGCTRHGGHLCDFIEGGVPSWNDSCLKRYYAGEADRVVVCRLANSHKDTVWSYTEQELLGEDFHADRDCTVCFSTYHGTRVYVAVTDNWREGDLFLLAIDTWSGNVDWRLRVKKGPGVWVSRWVDG